MGRLAALAAAAVVAACGVAGCGGSGGGGNGTAQAQAAAGGGGVPALQQALRHVVQTLSPSVVQIQTNRDLGSGVVFDGKGDIVTNAHVVETARHFVVTLPSGRRAKAALVGRWVPGDLAVVHTDASGLKPATFADSSKLQVGDLAVAVGNPLGLRSSVTQGIVSSLGRTVSEGNGVTLPSAIQTSAPINPGNSGGALADIQGRVIGIPTLAAVDQQLGGGAAPGIGFAIPSDTVKRIAGQLVAHGRVTASGRASLGIQAATVTGGGVFVAGTVPGGPADRAGLQRGDLIVALDGHPTPAVAVLEQLVAADRPGQTVKVTVRRPDGTQATVGVQLGQLAS
jgi:putative serine protease PepD